MYPHLGFDFETARHIPTQEEYAAPLNRRNNAAEQARRDVEHYNFSTFKPFHSMGVLRSEFTFDGFPAGSTLELCIGDRHVCEAHLNKRYPEGLVSYFRRDKLSSCIEDKLTRFYSGHHATPPNNSHHNDLGHKSLMNLFMCDCLKEQSGADRIELTKVKVKKISIDTL